MAEVRVLVQFRLAAVGAAATAAPFDPYPLPHRREHVGGQPVGGSISASHESSDDARLSAA